MKTSLDQPPVGVAPLLWAKWCAQTRNIAIVDPDQAWEQLWGACREEPGFAQAWPHLCLMCLHTHPDQANQSLPVLLKLQPEGNPALPPAFLAALMEHAVRVKFWHEHFRREDMEKLVNLLAHADQPQVLTHQAWRNWAHLGGWDQAGGLKLEGLNEALDPLPWYRHSRDAWFAKAPNRRLVARKLAEHEFLMGASRWRQMFDHAWAGVPTAHRPRFLADVSNAMCAVNTVEPSELHRVGGSYLVLLEVTGFQALEDTAWPQWWRRAMERVGDTARLNTLLYLIERAQTIRPVSPNGLVWEPSLARAWGKELGKLVGDTQRTDWPGSVHAPALRAIFQTHAWMSQWGGWKPGAMEAFQEGIEQGCYRWAQAMEHAPREKWAKLDLEDLWQQWSAQLRQEHLENRLGTTTVPRGSRPRM